MPAHCTKTFIVRAVRPKTLRLLLHAAAYVLHQQLRTQALQHTALSQAQPSTVITKLFKIGACQIFCVKEVIR
jgi:hypothetical protein